MLARHHPERARSARRLVTLALLLALLAGIPGTPGAAQTASPPSTAAPTGPADARLFLETLLAGLERLIGHLVPPPEPTGPTLAQLVGQKLVVRMAGTRPSAALLGRIERGEIGGVVLLGSNIRNATQLRRLTTRLQEAATTGGQPPLLICLDQEGGSVRRVAWAPPTISVPRMGARGSTAVARQQGKRTGAALGALGVNMDLAPVADVPRSRDSFMYRQGRTFGFDARVTARLADAFAMGLADSGVIATMKHFPGLGLAVRNTDHAAVTITATRARLARDLRPYRRAIRHGLPVVMLSNATYAAFDPEAAAGWSRAINQTLLRDELGFTGVTITDSLDGTGSARRLPLRVLGLRAAKAGTDMILTTGSERTTTRLFDVLLEHAQDGSLPRSELETSYARIIDLKSRVSGGSPP